MSNSSRSRMIYAALWWVAAVSFISGVTLILMRAIDVSVYTAGVYEERIVDVLPHGFALAGVGATVALVLLFLDAYVGRPFTSRGRAEKD